MKTIYCNGTVYTGELPLVQAFAVENGSFVFAGSDSDAKALAADGDQIVDLEGNFVCAGFNDSHMHLLSYGYALNQAILGEHTTSLEGMINYMKEYVAEHPVKEGAWIKGRGWNHDYFTDTDRMPNRYDLDKVSTTNPVYAVRACGHCMTVNSKALELLGITTETPQPCGGEIGIENGELDGRFYDAAEQLIYQSVPIPDKEEIKDMMRLAIKKLNSYGVTSSQSDDYATFRGLPWSVVNEAYQELEASGELTVRVYEQSNFTTVESLKNFVEAGFVTGVGTEYFQIGPLKMVGDGSLGARTAFLSRPYSDDPSTCGLPIFTQEQFDEMVGYAHAHGMQIAIHAIGDGCLDRVLNAYEKALKENPRDDHRHGIVHCQISRADQLKRMIDLDLHIYAQSIFIDYDSTIVRDRVGDMADTSYCWKTLLDGGLSVSNGTDCPVELPFAMGGIQCAVTRASLNGKNPPYLPEQAFTVREAIDSYTIHSAESSFEENVKGRIAPGYLADFVVLGGNPFETDHDKLKDIPVCATYVGGRQVYKA